MKLTFDIANKIKQDFQKLIGQKLNTTQGEKKIKEIVVLPIVNGSFGTFPAFYLLAADKPNFIIPFKDKEMSLVIYFIDDSYIPFFQYLLDYNVSLDLTKYITD